MSARTSYSDSIRSKALKPTYLLGAAGVSSLISINALRTNNLHMIQLRNDVYKADKDNGDVSAALTKLQQYVTSHMNTDLTPGGSAVYPPIQLKYTYERLQAAKNQPASNEQVYNDAQKHCEQQNSSDFSGGNRVPCIQEYVSTHGTAAQQTGAVQDSLYKYDFVSPAWSPDLAGWSALVTVLLILTAVGLQLKRLATKLRR